MRNRRSSYLLNLIGVIILLGGLSSAILIYRSAENDSTSILGYEEGSGSVYPVRPEDSKKYLRDMELYGGKANVLVDEFKRWFEGLWHGKSFAFIVGCVSILISLGFFYVANRRPYNIQPDIRNGNNKDRID